MAVGLITTDPLHLRYYLWPHKPLPSACTPNYLLTYELSQFPDTGVSRLGLQEQLDQGHLHGAEQRTFAAEQKTKPAGQRWGSH